MAPGINVKVNGSAGAGAGAAAAAAAANSTSNYLDRLARFREVDAERDALVAQILADYQDLKARFEEQEDDYKNEIASRRMWQGRAQNSEQALTEQKQTSVAILRS